MKGEDNMYNILTFEVLEDYIEPMTTRLFGRKIMFTLERKKGEILSIKHSIDDKTQKLINEGKLKFLRSLLEEKR